MSKPDRAELGDALAAVDAGHPETAEPILLSLSKRYPANSQIEESLGLIYAERGELTQALPWLEHASANAPGSALNHANLGTAWLKLGHPREAEAQLRMAATLDPRNAETLSALGQACMLVHNPADAAQAFSRAAALGLRTPDLLYNWAVALNQLGKTEQAETALSQIAAQDRTDQAESLAGDLEEKLGRYLQAVADYRKAAEMNPSEANLYALCVEFLRHWTWDDARKTAEYATAKYPGSMRLKLALGVALYGGRDFSGSAGVFKDLLERDPDNTMYADMLGRTCGELAGGSSACDALVSFAERHPGNPSAATYAAQRILDRPHGADGADNLDQARRLLAGAVAANPRLADAWYELGVLDAERQQWQLSVQMLKKATSLRPSFAPAHYQLARVYAHLGQADARNREMALFQADSQQEKDQMNAKLRAMTIFLAGSQ